jgi:uncharacterized membrane protein YbhN (UPF0104 family)
MRVADAASLKASTPAARRRAALRIGGSVVILAALFLLLPFGELVRAIRELPWFAWPIALVTHLSLHYVGTIKWRLLTNVAGAGLRARDAVRAYFFGLFGNVFLPSIIGGDVVRLGVALRVVQSPTGLVLGSIMDRLLDIIGLLALTGIGAVLSPLALDARSRGIFIGVAGVVLVGALAGLLALRLVPARRVPWKLRRRLVTVRSALRATARHPEAVVAALLLGMFLQGSLVVLNWWLGREIGIVVPLYVWLFVWPLAKIAALAPVTQGGIGVREAAQAVLFAPFGVSAVNAVAVGLVFEVVVLAGGLAGGLIAFLLRPRKAGAEPAPRAATRDAASDDAPALPR